MTKKAIYSWIGVVSGIVTILLAFTNPFQDKAKLDSYVRTIEFLPQDYIKLKQEKPYYLPDNYTSITIKNVGELPAKKVHVNFQKKYSHAIVSEGDDRTIELSGEPIYIERIEPDDEVLVVIWSSTYYLSPYNLSEIISISSEEGGRSIVRMDIEGEGFSWIFEEYFIFFVIGAFLLVFGGISVIVSMAEELQKKSLGGMEQELKSLSYAWTVGAISEDEFQRKSREIALKHLDIK